MKIALIMLAAGNSRRFGSNKLLYEIEGKPMYRHILEKLMIVAEWLEETECIEKVESGEHLEKQNEEGYKEEHIECNKVIAPLGEIKGKLFKQRECYKRITVVTQYEEIEQAARSMGVNVYINPHPDEGISSSLKIGLKANLDVDACLFTVSDQAAGDCPKPCMNRYGIYIHLLYYCHHITAACTLQAQNPALRILPRCIIIKAIPHNDAVLP